jgi:hypothetical protein
MSSRRLLILIRHLPDDSAFKLAFFDDWPRKDYLTTGVWNEIKAMRGDLYAILDKSHMSFRPVLPPSAQREQDEKRNLMRAGHDSIIAQIGGEKS